MSEDIFRKEKIPEDAPPVLKSWKNIYLLVVGFLLLQILLYYLISISFV